MRSKELVLLGAVVITLAACATVLKGGRDPASGYPEADAYTRPTGLKGQDAADFEHLSEGSEIYPYEWMMALKSVNFRDAQKKFTNPFYSHLNERFGIMESHNRGHYLMDYVGMSAAWSNHPPDRAEAYDSDRDVKVRVIGGVKSVKMVGTNCAMCHNGELTVRGSSFRVDGAPNMLNIRGYFEDLAQSTIAILAKKDLMTQFLKELNVPGAEQRADELQAYFMRALGDETNQIGHRVGSLSAILTLALAQEGNTSRFFKGKTAIASTLEKLLRVTYGFSDSDNIGELEDRMKFLGTLMTGTDPRSQETMSGYSRTDAFGRIGNLVLRGTNPINYTAPVSLPWIWGIRDMAMLHYTGNTNSVTLRNIGESLGLGAVMLGTNGDSTVNMHNLNRLEHLVYKIEVPRWESVFAGRSDLRVDHALAERGRPIYEQKCQKCHETSERVGPEKALYDYHMVSLEKIGTDTQAATNIIVPVEQRPFQDAILASVEKLKSRYYERYSVSPAEQYAWEFRALRGHEFFRDTLNGYTEQDQMGNTYGNIAQGEGYKARHLAGVWSTGPFLHNGSVPSVWDLLLPASARPRVFDVQSREFDPHKLGFASDRELDSRGQPKACAKKEQKCFDASLAGNHNTGHEYGVDLGDGDKSALIEYLKILKPEAEYGWRD